MMSHWSNRPQAAATTCGFAGSWPRPLLGSSPSMAEEEIGEPDDDDRCEVEIVLEAGNDLEGLVGWLRALPETVLKVTVSIHGSIIQRRILEEIGRLPSLRHLALSTRLGVMRGADPLEDGALTGFFRRSAARLETLQMQIITLSDSSLEELGESLREHASLKEFRMETCHLQEQWQESNALDRILVALSTIPTLEVASFYSTKRLGLGRISSTPLGDICRAPLLSQLCLRHFQLDQQQLENACAAVAGSISLIELTLGYCLATNDSDESMAHMLQKNATLETLCLLLDEPETDNIAEGSSLLETARALLSNTTLKQMTVWGRTTKDTQHAFFDMVQVNHTLELLWLDENQLHSETLFFVSLNCTRRQLLEDSNTTKRDWIEAIISKRNLLDAIFYLLSSNPSLCQNDAEQTT